jgi:hypothetical protein
MANSLITPKRIVKAATQEDQEIGAIGTVYSALRDLDGSAQQRVIDYVRRKLNVPGTANDAHDDHRDESSGAVETEREPESSAEAVEDDLEGVSPVARKWMRRNALSASKLSEIFSLGGDEIDLVVKKVPGTSNKARAHNVFLLKGIAAYLAGGAARFTHEQVKETCLHYDAYDSTNFSKYVKDFSADVSGTKESGYTLTARGLVAATAVVREMIGEKKAE